nr:hypothetical protein [Cupriavidus sp. D39]
MMVAHAAAKTQRIRMGTAVCILPVSPGAFPGRSGLRGYGIERPPGPGREFGLPAGRVRAL